jgi:hypothetical protein
MNGEQKQTQGDRREQSVTLADKYRQKITNNNQDWHWQKNRQPDKWLAEMEGEKLKRCKGIFTGPLRTWAVLRPVVQPLKIDLQ